MPGVESTTVWIRARKVAEVNYYQSSTQNRKYFDVAPLLKMTTGLDMKDIASLVSRKEELEEMRNDMMLRGIDREKSNFGTKVGMPFPIILIIPARGS